MIDGRLTTGQLAKAIGRNRATIWRWIHDGVTIRGQRIKLAAVRIGARVEVTPEQYADSSGGCPEERNLSILRSS